MSILIAWPLGGGSNLDCDYPVEGDVRKTVEYANGTKEGTYVPNMQSTTPGFVRVPNVQSALTGWLQPMTFYIITKTQDEFVVVEESEEVGFKGVWQPMKPQAIAQKPEGQRAWKWFTCHAEVMLELSPDDVIVYEDNQYRVMEKLDYKKHGFYEYHIVADYTGSGPT